jgi:transposase
MDLNLTTCPKCGGTATLLQLRHDFEEVHDLNHPTEKARIPVKVEEFRCQAQSCEHEFEKIVRELS